MNMQQMAKLWLVKIFISHPPLEATTCYQTNLSGHPAVVVPNGFSRDGTPSSSLTFTGHLFDEATVLSIAKAYQVLDKLPNGAKSNKVFLTG